MKKLLAWLAVVMGGLGIAQRAPCGPALPASDSYKLHTDLSKLPPDISVWLGKSKAEIVPVLQGIDFIEEKEQGRWLPKLDVDSKEQQWRRLIFMITWINADGVSLGRPMRVSFNAESGKIWYIHLPVKPQSKMPKVGTITASDTFQTCVAKLGQPASDVQTAPVTREAAWQIGAATYRITYYSEEYRDMDRTFSKGEIEMISIYRKDLAAPGFDDKPTVYDPSKGWQ